MTITSISEAFDYPDELRVRIKSALELVEELRRNSASVLAEAAQVLGLEESLDASTMAGLKELGLDSMQIEAIGQARFAVSPSTELVTCLSEFESDIADVVELHVADDAGIASPADRPHARQAVTD